MYGCMVTTKSSCENSQIRDFQQTHKHKKETVLLRLYTVNLMLKNNIIMNIKLVIIVYEVFLF